MSAGQDRHILAFNNGSSSLKLSLYRTHQGEVARLLSGEADLNSAGTSEFRVWDPLGRSLCTETMPTADQGQAITRLVRLFVEFKMPSPDAIGHRIVHGGPTLRHHCLIDNAVLRCLEDAAPFAPLHLPAALSIMRLAEKHFPGLPQVACFDTAFHIGLPDIARVLPIPKEWRAAGIERYGFHGLSCKSILRQLGGDVPRRLIIAHLGNGSSITAVKDGLSIDTSMGLTPSGGVIMGTRSGDLDPGVLIYLMREKKLDDAELESLIDHRSGLLGISDLSGDMRRLQTAAPSNPDAQLAIAMFCQSVRKQIAAMAAVLEGVDLIVFTGGIGENAPLIRNKICDGLSWMGGAVQVVATQEDEQIVRHTAELLSS